MQIKGNQKNRIEWQIGVGTKLIMVKDLNRGSKNQNGKQEVNY